MWTVLPISSLCASELDKDTCSCVPDVSVFTCSLWGRPYHVTESHVCERCFGVPSRLKGIVFIIFSPSARRPLVANGLDFFRGHFGHTKGLPPGNLRQCLSNCEWETDEVCTACAKTNAELTFFKSSLVSRLDRREPFKVSIWFGRGVIWGGHSMLCFLWFCVSMFWPGMIINQGQLSIVVSDWEPYLGSPFPHLSVWVVVFVCWHYSLKLHGWFLDCLLFLSESYK